MKKIGNKFIIAIIFIIACIVFFQVYVAYSQSNRDTNSYVSLISGNATLNEVRLGVDIREVLGSGDNIRVIGESSIAVIQWGDGSMTRLGGNTKIQIKQNEISRDFTDINISFELLAGKTWSNVVSFIGSDSSFTQSFDGVEAGVRGTVFDVDLDKGFLHVTDHSVELTDESGKTVIVPEGQALSLETFSLVEISRYLGELKDAAWTDINTQLDTEYLLNLKANLESSIQGFDLFAYLMRFISPKYALFYVLDTYDNDDNVETYINKMSDEKKNKVYDSVLSKYQGMNFVSGESNAYGEKLRYKKALILLDVEGKDSERLVATAGYDLQDIIKSGGSIGLSDTVAFIENNIDTLSGQDLSILKGGLEYIPEGLLDEFSGSFESLGNILDVDFSQIKNINTDSIGDVLDSADGAVQDFLDDSLGGFLEKISK